MPSWSSFEDKSLFVLHSIFDGVLIRSYFKRARIDAFLLYTVFDNDDIAFILHEKKNHNAIRKDTTLKDVFDFDERNIIEVYE